MVQKLLMAGANPDVLSHNDYLCNFDQQSLQLLIIYGANFQGFPQNEVISISRPFKDAMIQFIQGIFSFNQDTNHPLHLFQGLNHLIEYIGRLVMPLSDQNPIPSVP
jgi:hypothetical protein